jgi:aminoglycoside phosphotransferase (APT) family kinase protein
MTDAPRSEVKRSSRDPELLGPRLEEWLAAILPADANPSVSGFEGTSATGMSSETILFDATWTQERAATSERLVARLAPDSHDCPVFPSYDMERQARVISTVGELTDVPVPRILGANNDPSVVGAPFFVMERIDGIVPPDVMPYTFGDNWFFDASPDSQQRLVDSTVDVLVSLHGIEDAERTFDFLRFDQRGGTALRRHVAHTRAWYEFACRDTPRSGLVERMFDWLEAHWPSDEGTAVLSWGDARIGNVMYRDFRPVAVLDWEMAGLGPRELDVAWLVFAHRVFEHLAGRFGAPGMPHVMRPDDVAADYERKSGHTPKDLDFYTTYCAVQWGIVFLRTGFRSVHFGEREMPADPEEFFHCKELFEEVMA